ncbi:hypothetical protein Tco_0178181 [Tanacetum coccineum]
MQTTIIPEQVKTQKIQAGVKVSRLEDKDVIFSFGSTLEDFIMLYFVLVRNIEYRVLRGFLLHRSSINNSASLSNKFGESYFIFKFGISGLLHHVVTAIADRIREQVKTQKIQAGVQVSRLKDKDVIFNIGSALEVFILLYFVLVWNILFTQNLDPEARQLQKTFDDNSSELGIHDHNSEPSSSKLVPNVYPSANTIAQSLQELDLIFSPLYDEFFTTGNSSVLKSSSPSDNSQQ